MKHKLIEFFREFLVVQMNHWTLIIIYLTLMGILKQDEPLLNAWILMSILPLYHYFLRRKIKNIIIFYLLHAIIPVACFFMPFENIVVKLLYCLMVIIYVVWSATVKIKGVNEAEELFHPIFCIAVIGGTSLLQDYMGYSDWVGLYLPVAFLYLGCYFMYVFLERYQNFITVNKYSASNIPENEIFASGLLQTVIYISIGLGILLLSANIEWFAYLAKKFGYGVFWIARTLLVWLGGDTVEELPQEGEKLSFTNGGFGEMSDGQTFILWKILEYIVLPVVSIAIILAILFGIYKFLMYLWKNFIYKQYKENVLQSGRDVRENVVIEKNIRPGLKVFSIRNNREKVRKMYKKQILNDKFIIIGDSDTENLKYMTAKECCEKLDETELKNIYEKARYSREEITAEDLKLLKQAAR